MNIRRAAPRARAPSVIRAVCRFLACRLLVCWLPACWFLAVPWPALAGDLVIPGTGDSQAMLRALAEDFTAAHPHIRVFIPDSVGSSGGVKAVLDNDAPMARVARELSPDESGKGLRWRLFALGPVVVVANRPGCASVSLDYGQLKGIYDGSIRDYAQLGCAPGKMYPVMRERGDSSLGVLQRFVPGLKDIREPVGKVYYTTPETVDAIAGHPGALGFAPLAAVQGRGLDVLAVEGVEPTPDNVRSGAYAMTVPLALVYVGAPVPDARAFMHYLAGPEAAGTMARFGCVPASSMPQAPRP